jgi:hypothetical protein
MSSFKLEATVYVDHIASLVVPGRQVKEHAVIPHNLAAVGELNDWSDDELKLLIEECRRTLDGQHSRFDRLRTTAQVVLPISVALLVAVATRLRHVIAEPTDWLRYALGAAATLAVRSDFGSILPTVVSQLGPPILPKIARAYAGQVAVGETTIGTRITVIRDAITLLVLGGVVQVLLWLVDVL